MIDEQELYALGDTHAGPYTSHRPVEEVLARGTRLRRRRQAGRAVGLSAVVAGLLGAGLVVQGQGGGQGDDVRVGEDPTTTSPGEEQPTPPPPPVPADCDATQFVPVDVLPYDQVPDAARLLPSFVPADPAITYAAGTRSPDVCYDAPYPADSALVLRPDDGSDSSITVEGPAPLPGVDGIGFDHTPTDLRGVPATRLRPAGDPADVMFGWTEADGWSWTILGRHVDDATVRAVAEALVLDSSPDDATEPAAGLDATAVPAGYHIAAQPLGPVFLYDHDAVTWEVTWGDLDGMRCMLRLTTGTSEEPLSTDDTPGTEPATVNGQPALWWPLGGQGPFGLGSLVWSPAPGLTANMGCLDQSNGGYESIPQDTMVQVAESFAPVAPDDPRLPAFVPPDRSGAD